MTDHNIKGYPLTKVDAAVLLDMSKYKNDFQPGDRIVLEFDDGTKAPPKTIAYVFKNMPGVMQGHCVIGLMIEKRPGGRDSEA